MSKKREASQEVCLVLARELARTPGLPSQKHTALISAFADRRCREAYALVEEIRAEFGKSLTQLWFDRQFTDLVRKVPWDNSDIDVLKAAKAGFFDTERRCKAANKRFRHFGRFLNRMPDVPRVILSRAKARISRVLGSPEKGIPWAKSLARHGKGLSIGTWNRYRCSPVYKDSASTWAVTPACLIETCQDIPRERTYHAPYELHVVPGARWSTVPKDGKIRRNIAVEPLVNMRFQLGLHEFLRSRLESRAGVDIGSQGVNQELSRLASLSGDSIHGLATVDLSNASDSISVELVRFLLPPTWFEYFDSLRCSHIKVDGEWVKSEKFSTMGNGFTFALETLIFWAISEECRVWSNSTGLVSAYGDDLIIPRWAYATLLEVFRFCGFTVNSAKSFAYGPFRESCGTDWYEGVEIPTLKIDTLEMGPRDLNLFFNTATPILRRLRPVVISILKERGLLVFGLENEDASSCIFASLDYCQRIGAVKWHPHWQTFVFKGYRETGAHDKSAPVEWRLLQSLQSIGLETPKLPFFGSKEQSKLNLRGLTKVRLRRFTTGVKPAAAGRLNT